MFFVLCIVTRYVNDLALNLLVKNLFAQSIVLSICSEKRHFKMFIWPLNAQARLLNNRYTIRTLQQNEIEYEKTMN